MAYITADIRIPEIFGALTVHLYFPTDLPEEVGNKVKGVVTLLHGMGNSGADWMQYSAAPRYAADNGYILVAPDCGNSFFVDMAGGPPWYTILTQLLPPQLERIFRIPAERETNYIAGLSMGGYGAMLLGLSQPQRYAAVGSFSGALDMAGMLEGVKANRHWLPLFAPLFGPELDMPEACDLMALARKAAALPQAERPRIYCTCGAQDADEKQILTQNHRFARLVESLPLDFCYEEWDGIHEWNFWDRSLAQFIGFIQNSAYGEAKRGDWAAPVQ